MSLDGLFNNAPFEVPANWHEDFIVGLAALLRPRVYVELGLYHCDVFNRVIPYAGRLVGVDVDSSAGEFMQSSPKAEFVASSSVEYVLRLWAEPLDIDMLFIDADHSRDAVLRDFLGFLPFVSDQGLILLHDTYPRDEAQTDPGFSGTAWQAVEVIRDIGNLVEMMTIPVPPGLTICRKRSSQVPWATEPLAASAAGVYLNPGNSRLESIEPAGGGLETTDASGPPRKYKIVCISQVFNELIRGNLERFVDHVLPLVDDLVVYDDGSTDGSYEYLMTKTPHLIRGYRNDFANEMLHKQTLLSRALELDPDFILWLDADEVLSEGAAQALQPLCAHCESMGIDGISMHELNIWRSDSWRRTDSLFDEGWFTRLWRATPGMSYGATAAGLHQQQYPPSIQRIERTELVKVLHYGFSDERRLAHKYLVYRSHGQRGYDMLDRLISEERLVVERVPAQLFPPDLRREDPEPVAMAFEQSLEYVESYRDEVFKPRVSIICLVYKSVQWLNYVYEQVLAHTDMSDKEFFFVANDPTDEVVEYLRSSYIPHHIWRNSVEQQSEWFINNVYRAYNYGARVARGDFLVFVNSDMGFSPGWLDALWSSYDGSNCLTSRLVESGKFPSGLYGISRDFGQDWRTYREDEFLRFARSVREEGTSPGGLYMPLFVRASHFEQVGGYPEGNIIPGGDLFDPQIAQQGEECVTGDLALMQRLESHGISHHTANGSVVYHFQCGEKDSSPTPVHGTTSIVAICNDLVTGTMGERVLWDFLLDALPAAVGVDTRVVGEHADYAVLAREYLSEHYPDLPIVVQNATFIGIVDSDRYTIGFLQDDLRAMGRPSEYQEANLRACRRLVTNSIRTAISYPEFDFDLIPIGVDDTLFRPLDKNEVRRKHGIEEGRVGIFVGSFTETKGWDHVRDCVEAFPDILWILVTKLPEAFKARNARVYSRISQELLAELYNCADFFILGSPVETQGLAAIEACLCDIPVLMRKVGIFSQFTDEERARLGVFSDDFLDAVERIQHVEATPRQVIIEKGLTIERTTGRWIALLTSVAQELAIERFRRHGL